MPNFILRLLDMKLTLQSRNKDREKMVCPVIHEHLSKMDRVAYM